jgi:hypothetical protein
MKNYFDKFSILISFLLIINSSFLIRNSVAQWVQTEGIYGGDVYSVAISGNNIFAGSYGNGVYISTNNGTNWTQTALNNKAILSLATNGNMYLPGQT